MSSCVMCGASLPSNQGSKTCSICYGDPDHGRDGYYQQMLDEDRRRQEEEEHGRQMAEEGRGYE